MGMDPIWYPEDSDDEFVFEDDFVLTIDGRSEPGGGLSFTENAQDAVLAGYIPANKIRSAARFFLGYSYADSADPFRLYREPPMVHPQMPNLRCHGFAAGGDTLKPIPSQDSIIVSPFVGPNYETLKYTSYHFALVTLRFKSFGRMRFLLDTDIEDYAQEITRYTRSFSESAVQTLSVDGRSQMRFRETVQGGPALDQPFPAPLAQLLAKVSLKVLWANVPHEYISNNDVFLYAKKLIERLGTVNNFEYMGNAKGTLLFTAFSAEEILFPVLSLTPTFKNLTGWNITLCFEQFDPQKGVPASEYRGHRVFPFSGNGLFFYCTRENGGKELLPLTDYNKLTQHVLDDS